MSEGGALAVVAHKPWDARLARRLVWPLRESWVTPNHLTTLSLLLALAAGALYATGAPGVVDGAAALFIGAALVDHADGELARLSGKFSHFGYYYDHAVGAVSYVALFTGIGVGLNDTPLGMWAIPAGVVAGVSVSLIFTLRFAMEHQRGRNTFTQPAVAGMEIEDIMYLIAPVTWAGGLYYFLLLASVGAPLFALWLLGQYRRIPTDARR